MSNFQYAIRNVLKHRAFPATAVLTLAIGIGACTALISVAEDTLVHPVPLEDADRIFEVQFTKDASRYGLPEVLTSTLTPALRVLRDQSDGRITELTVSRLMGLDMESDSFTERLLRYEVLVSTWRSTESKRSSSWAKTEQKRTWPVCLRRYRNRQIQSTDPWRS